MRDPLEPELLELDIPDGVPEAKEAVELIRAWVADGALVVTLNGEALGDRLQEWGRLLAHIGHHVAHATSLTGQMSESESLTAIRRGFDAALSMGEGEFSGKVRGRITH